MNSAASVPLDIASSELTATSPLILSMVCADITLNRTSSPTEATQREGQQEPIERTFRVLLDVLFFDWATDWLEKTDTA